MNQNHLSVTKPRRRRLQRALRLASVALFLTVAACAKTDDEPVAAANDGAELGDSSAPGVSDSEVTIGYIGDLTGPDVAIELPYFKGMQAAVDAANAKGGAGGRKINLVSEDTHFDVAQATAAYNKLTKQSPVLAILGINVSNMITALTAQISADKVPVLGPTGVTAETLANPYIFNIQASLPVQSKALIDFIGQKLQSPTLGTARISSVSGDEWQTLVENQVGAIKGKVSSNQKIAPADAEATAQVSAFKGENVTGLTLHSSTKVGIVLQKSMQTQGLDVPVFSSSGANGLALWQSAGSLSDKVFAADAFSPPYTDVPGQAAVMAALKEQGTLDQYQADKNWIEGWVIANAVVESLDRAGKDLTRASFIKALQDPAGFDTGGYSQNLNWSKSNEGPTQVRVFGFDQAAQKIKPVSDLLG